MRWEAGRTAVSPELVGAFEQQWPEVARKLQGLLAGKSVPSCKRDDIVQETGLRLFGMWEKVDRARPVWPLAVTIALNLLRDEARRHPEREVLGAVPDVATGHDVEHEGLARIELERVQQAMAQLSPSHRDVLLNEIAPHPDIPRTSRNATKMMRLRARRALTTLLETAVLRAGIVGLKIRQTLGLNDPLLPLRVGPGESAAPAAALALAALLFGSIQVQPPDVAHAGEHPERSVVADASDAHAADALVSELGADGKFSVAGRALTARADGAAGLSERATATRDRRSKKGGENRGRHRDGPPNWGAPPPDDSSPIEVPLPVGEVYLGGGAGVGPTGVELGNRPGGSAPACVSGVEPGSLGCGTPPSKRVGVKAGASAEANGQQVGAEIDEEVSTDIT